MIARLLAAVLALLPTGAAPARRGVPLAQRPIPVVQCSWRGVNGPQWLTIRTVTDAGWPTSEAHNLCLVIVCESQGHLDAYRDNRPPLGDTYGPLQIMASSLPWSRLLAEHAWTATDLHDPHRALTIGYEGWQANGRRYGGDGGWSCATLTGVH